MQIKTEGNKDMSAKNKWFKEVVVYQIYPRSFYDTNRDGIGDINGIIEKLDYIKELGVDVIWLSPVYKSPNDDNGYDISDYRDIMDEFGSLSDCEKLICETHKRGMKLLMDLVVNHTSDEHKWFVESKKSKDNKYRDYYIWRKGKDGAPPNRWRSNFSFSAWEYDKNTDEYYLHCFSKKQPDLNWQNEKVRKEVYDLMRFWLDKGIDGFRMDVINFIGKPLSFDTDSEVYTPNLSLTHKYLKEMNKEVLSKYDIMTVGETPGVTPSDAIEFTGESKNELNMVFQFEHTTTNMGEGQDKWAGNKADIFKVKKAMSKWQTQMPDDGWNSLFLDNHDRPRRVSDIGDDSEKYREISAKMLATMTFMLKGTPYIYQGEEIGMTNVKFDHLEDYRDIETINAVKERAQQENISQVQAFEEMKEGIYVHGRDNARTPMQWSSEKNAGFTDGTPWIKVNPNYKEINVENNLKDKDSVFYYYKKLIEMRKKYDVIVYGDYKEYLENNKEGYFYTRELGQEKMLVLLNFKRENITVKIPKEALPKDCALLINNYKTNARLESEMTLRPYQSLVYLGRE